MLLQAEARNMDLEQVAPFKKWKEIEGHDGQKVSVNKGEKGFSVLFPFEYTVYERDEKGRILLDENGEKIPQLDENGQIKKSRSFGVGYVFDIKQTNAREIGAYHELNYQGKDVPLDSDLVKEVAGRITEKYKIPVRFVKDPYASAGGWYTRSSNIIFINLSKCDNNAHRLGTLFHELGHARMHKNFDGSRELAEGQAEAFAYAASSAFGIERDSQFYIKNWIENDYTLPEVMGCISRQVKEVFNDLKLHELAQQQCRGYKVDREQVKMQVA